VSRCGTLGLREQPEWDVFVGIGRTTVAAKLATQVSGSTIRDMSRPAGFKGTQAVGRDRLRQVHVRVHVYK
jgi:hypothetical protein